MIVEYSGYCHSKLKLIDFPMEFINCAHGMCSDTHHFTLLNQMYTRLVNVLTKGAELTYVGGGKAVNSKRKYVPGWNMHVRGAHEEARLWYQTWLLHNKPRTGFIYNNMCKFRNIFKSKLKYCQDNEQQIKMDIIAKNHAKKQFGSFWKSTNRLNPRTSRPVSVAGVHEPASIANAFKQHFKVDSMTLRDQTQMFDADAVSGDVTVHFTAKEIASVISGMKRGKSPGHDGLSIEHLKHAGVHLPRVLAMFFNLCVSHCYLPDDLIYTTVVPIVKNKTGDASDISNYRPISLATVTAKVLDRLLDKQLSKHIILKDSQFGFRPGLSTESAILCLKQTVQYYTDRKTPVFACFLDLSKAFDLVNYKALWRKLQEETTLPGIIINLFKYWYNNQRNSVKWEGSFSDVYRLECGVRQGGLSSPRIFNLYMDRLIGELSNTNIGCHIDGVCVNNFSYADDMVLLSPSIGALRRLVSMCEAYAIAQGLKYNAKKSEIMVFKAGAIGYPTIPEVSLGGAPLNRVTSFKYLGHWVTDDFKDNKDIDRERRSLSVRCNMLARRFARCTEAVKITLFKAFCSSFYTCSLWTSYSLRAYSDLRVQYNNALRILLRLPWRCSASKMFAERHIDGFAAIMRKRSASLLARLRGSTNSILSLFADRWESPMLRHWMKLHNY